MKLVRRIGFSILKITTLISPKLNTELCYFLKFKRKLNLKNPQTFNEKILWLKLNNYNNNSLVKKCADKYLVRSYVEEKCGKEILVPLIGIFNNFDDINISLLPDSFVIKSNGGYGSIIICNDRNKFNLQKYKKDINKWFKDNYYLTFSELQYKNIETKILIEPFLSNNKKPPIDYKVYCYNGVPKYILVCTGRFSEKGTRFTYFDCNWNLLNYDISTDLNLHLNKPHNLNEMLNCAKKLSKEFPFVRVDFYIVNEKIYFGEMTFTPNAGLDDGLYKEADLILGNELNLNFVGKE